MLPQFHLLGSGAPVEVRYNSDVTYDGTKDSLRNIVEWLEGTETAGWDDQAALAAECVSDLKRMLRPIYGPDKTGSLDAGPPSDNPYAEQLETALPHAEALLRTIRSRNRAAALSNAKSAFAAL